MSRRKAAKPRVIVPDQLYSSQVVAKFINVVMRAGKKTVAENIVYGAFKVIESKIKESPLEIFNRALEHVRPVVEVRSRRVGGATYQVPVEVRANRAQALAMSWIIESAFKRGEKSTWEKLAGEILDAADENSSVGGSTGKGGAIKKREDTHRMADANKAFAHYNWATG